MRTKKGWLIVLFVIISLLSLTVIWVGAQEGQPPREQPGLAPDVPEATSNFIPVQGRLTDENGVPLNGTYSVAFRLYDVSSGGTALCEDVKSLSVTDGLFSTYFSGVGCSIDGRQLYLGVEVEDDGEMTPRQYVDNVPVAWTLRPGAFISGTLGSNAILDIENWASNGRGLRAYAMDQTGTNYGVVGASRSPNGYGGYFYNNGGGAAIRAGGTGIIQSEAPTYLWISGNGVRPYHQTDSTIINMDTIGGALIYQGATGGFKNVMLPITLPGTLYGQHVRVTDMDIYWQGNTDLDAITAVLLRRQTGVCSTSACYATIHQDTDDHVCDAGNFPTGCVQHYDLTMNNVLTADSGVLYLTLELGFSGASTWIDLGGVRLTLEYDD